MTTSDQRMNPTQPRPVSQALRLSTLVLGAVLMAGCFGKKPPAPPKPAVLDVATVASSNLNPDSDGRASPLVVRIYALRALAEFERSDFFSLYEKDEQILAADLVKRDEMILKPGETITLKREFAPDVQFIAIVGAYRDVERSTWRATLALPPGATGTLAIKADAKGVSLALEKPAKE